MHVISNKSLREFWLSPGNLDAKKPLEAWCRVAKRSKWQSANDIKATYRSFDVVGDCGVFDIGGNKYRLIARMRYETQRVYVLKVMTHKEYDKDKWKKDCGCFQPPPPVTKRIIAKPRTPKSRVTVIRIRKKRRE